MNSTINSKDLLTKEDRWNAIISVISEYDFPGENRVANDVFIVFQYYSELESGGHESLFTSFSDYIVEKGIADYIKELIDILHNIDAHDYALIVKKYSGEIWKLYNALENGEIEENEFYHVIENADNAYYNLDNKLEGRLEMYFENIYHEIIEVIEN